MTLVLDSIDRRLLSLLQQNARISNADLARDLGMAASAVLERVRKLEQRGVIAGYATRLDPRALGLSLMAFVFVRAEENGPTLTVGDALQAIPGVQEVHNVAGEDCYLVKLRARDPEDLGRVLREQLGRIPGVRGTKTTIVLSTLKDTTDLPPTALGGVAERGRPAG